MSFSAPSAGVVRVGDESITGSRKINGPSSPSSSKAAVRGVICNGVDSALGGVRGGRRGVGGALLDLLVMKLNPLRAIGFMTGVVERDLVPVVWLAVSVLLTDTSLSLSFVGESCGADSFLRMMGLPTLRERV